MARTTRSLIPPQAQRRRVEIARHGDVRIDEFFWLRERTNPEVLRYLADENEYTAAAMAHTQALQETLYGEMLGRIRETDYSAPLPEGTYWYYERTEEGKDYPILYRCRTLQSNGEPQDEEVMLDVNALAEGHAFCDLGDWRVSPDGRLLAYALDVEGNEAFVVHVKDLLTGDLLPDRMLNAYYGLQWSSHSQDLFYTTLGDAHRPDSVWRHRVGDHPAADVRVLHERDERYFVEIQKSSSGEYLLVALHSNTTNEVWFVPAANPTAEPQVIAPRRLRHEYSVDHRGDHFYIVTNAGAQNFRVVTAPVATPGESHWQELVAHDESFLIEHLLTFKDHLVLVGRSGGLPTVQVLHLELDGPRLLDKHTVAFAEPAYTFGLVRNAVYDTASLYYAYSSLVTPNTVYAYDMQARTHTVVKQDVVQGYQPDLYVTQRIWATAPDGTQVPISLAYRKDLQRNGANPAFLYGYGAYGANVEPRFQSQRVSLLDRGFVIALAHVRGGSELGRAWYENGKVLHKRNSFTDFVACAENLIAEGFTSPDLLVAGGRSAGGLLMGAVTNLRPDLFAAVLAGVPFMDVINTMLDSSIPLTAMEYEEWGDPNDPEQYAYMRSYSPYDNLTPRPFPRLLVTGGLHDPRVQYWEPAKYVARLRLLQAQHAGPNRLVLLHTIMTVGHGGPTGRYAALRETAFEYAFFLDAVGMAPEKMQA